MDTESNWAGQVFTPRWVLFIAAVLLFARLGANELGSADEATHAQVAREMVRDGHWLYPTCRGEPYLEKPPLKLWLTAATFLVAGESEVTARIWSSLFALGTIAAVIHLGTLLFNRGVGCAAGLVLATTGEFVFNHCGRTGEMDSGLLFFMTLAVIAFWRLRATGEPRHLDRAALWLALGFLTKGHAILIPLLWLPLVWWIRPDGKEDKSPTGGVTTRRVVRAIALFLVLTTPWFIVQIAHYGTTGWRFLIEHHVTESFGGQMANAKARLEYCLNEMVRTDYPWPPLMILGVVASFCPRLVESFPSVRAARAWLLAWIGTVFLILALSQTALPWYHLPAVIPMAVLAGCVLERWWNPSTAEPMRRWDRLWFGLHLGLFFLIAGFASGLWQLLKALVHRDVETASDYAYYFVRAPHHDGVAVTLVVVAGMLMAALARRRPHKRSSMGSVPRLAWARPAFVGLVAVAAMVYQLCAPDQLSERSRQMVRDIHRESVRLRTGGDLHVFDAYRSSSPHCLVEPALYYYLASSRKLSLRLHPPDPSVWQNVLQDVSPVALAIVPSEWVQEQSQLSTRLTVLRTFARTSLVCVESVSPTLGGGPQLSRDESVMTTGTDRFE